MYQPQRHISQYSNADSQSFSCPLCPNTYALSTDLQVHVNKTHKEILSPNKARVVNGVENQSEACPLCGATSFPSVTELSLHVDRHFDGWSNAPISSCIDSAVAREIEKQQREEHKQFLKLQAEYGMDNRGNYSEQSLAAMQRDVYRGKMTVAEFYDQKIQLRHSECHGQDDKQSLTKGIIPKIRNLSQNSSDVKHTFLCTTIDHYATSHGDRGWGCGYRNIQMLLSCLQTSPLYASQLKRLFGTGVEGPLTSDGAPTSPMPSISTLQQLIEEAWKEGYDSQGCEQLGGRLRKSRKWIGATELVTLLSYFGIQCELVDFHRPSGPNNSHPVLLRWIYKYFSSQSDFVPPLYLQHQGHSRTIVGLEECGGGSLRALLLDPGYRPQQSLSRGLSPKGFRVTAQTLKSTQYQIVAVKGVFTDKQEMQRSKVIKSTRIP